MRWVLAGVAALAVALAVNTVVTNRETRSASAGAGRLVPVDGQRLHVREDGDPRRPALLLVHGLAGSVHVWDRLVPRLTHRYRVIRVDLLGHGGSDKPRDGYAPEPQADRLARLLERLRAPRALLVGHSLGGMIGVALAERHPERLRGLVAIGTPARPGDVDLPAAARLGTRPLVGQLLHRLVSDGMVRDALSESLGEGGAVPDRFVRDYRAMTFSAYAGSYRDADAFGGRCPTGSERRACACWR